MSDVQQQVEKQIRLSSIQAQRLRQFAMAHHTSEDLVVTRALDILFSITELLDDQVERAMWSGLSDGSLARVWDNDTDAAYDNWRELYGVPAG
jgi:hypothetical protein